MSLIIHIFAQKIRNMNKYLLIASVLCILLLQYQCSKTREYKEKLNTATLNIKAYEAENDSLKNNIREFQFTMNDLKTSSDTINQKIVQVIKEGGIKEKTVERVEYINSIIEKKDTVVFKDTIFKQDLHPIDTVLGDSYYTLDLHLAYPDTIVTKPQFVSEKYIIVNQKKEYVKPKSKWFFIRWFQKKRKYIAVDVIEKNPYINDTITRFINIIK